MTTPTRSSRARAVPAAPDAPPPPAPADRHQIGRDPDGGTGEVHELLVAAVDEAARLLDADGAMVYLLDPATGHLRFAHDAGIRSRRSRAWVRSIDLPVGVGMFGRAVAERGVVMTRDYLDDPAFAHAEDTDRVVRDIGIRSMVVAPLVAGETVFGAMGTFSSRFDAFSPSAIALVRALADHAAAAMANARLIEALDASSRELAERADVERSLREIAARISAAADLPAVLQLGVDEAARLLRADGARIDLIDPDVGLLRWAFASGAVKPDDEQWPDDPDETLDQGISGQAVATGRAFWSGDYIVDTRFPHGPGADHYIRTTGLRSVMAAPLIVESGPIGALTVFSSRPDAWSEVDGSLLEAIAAQAAITIRTTRLFDELDQSRTVLARRAEAEQALREIAARITALREPDVILDRVVDEARRLLGTDGAHLTRMGEDGTYLVPVVVTGVNGADTQAWLLDMEFPLGGGINGLAAQLGEPVWTSDYTADPRIPHEGNDDEVANRLGLRGMAAAPLRAPGGDVIGTLAISSATPRTFDAEELDLLQGLADQAAIAITNSTLLSRLTESEERYRYLVENAPDLVWSIGADTRLTFLSDSVERLTGFRPEDLIGRHFGALVHESSREVAQFDWSTGMDRGAQELRGRVNLLASDGSSIPAEYIATARLDDSGAFIGANGSVRDMRERDRLERDLRRQAGELAAGEERAHLARELHDSVTQALFSMTLVSRSVEMLLDRDLAAARAQLVQLRDLQREALAEMRALIFELRPGNLEHDGLSRALRTHTAALQGRIGLPVVVESTLDERLPLPVEEVLYRISQEALHNVVKHAGARHVRLELGRIASGVRLRISDDGKGFDPARVPDGHLGLAGMRARADKIDARFSVKSVPGEGTTIEVLVPNAGLTAAGAAPPPADPDSIRDG